MRSGDESFGLKLLNKWVTDQTSIQLVFNGIGDAVSFTAVGVLAIDKLEGTLVGNGCDVHFDLTGVGFDNIVTEAGLAQTGARQGESVEVVLRSGDKFVLSTLLRVGERPS